MNDLLTGLTPAGRANPHYKHLRRRRRLDFVAEMICTACRRSSRQVMGSLLGDPCCEARIPHVVIRWRSNRLS